MAEWSTNDLRTAALSNQKNVYVMDSSPGTAYDGQVWVCTSSDPPLVKVYDATNTQWMDYHPLYYETVESGQMPAVTPITNGTLTVAYDTDQSSATLFAYANGSWRDMGGTLQRAYPVAGVTSSAVVGPGAQNVPALYADTHAGYVAQGAEHVIVSGLIQPAEDGVTVVAIGALGAAANTNKSGEIRLYLNGVKMDSEDLTTTAKGITLTGATDNMSATAYDVDIRVYSHVSGGSFYWTCAGVGGYSVKT